MIVLVTDFGLAGPYTGQIKYVLTQLASHIPVIDLFADAPRCNPKATAYLLAAYGDVFPTGTVFLTVVDPGVGSDRPAGILRANGRWYVGPGNGVFEIVLRRAETRECKVADLAWWSFDAAMHSASATFHGRDIFAPAAAAVAMQNAPLGDPASPNQTRQSEWPDDLPEVVYTDVYGNAMIGVRATMVDRTKGVRVGACHIPFGRTFSDVTAGALVCYENANGLLEIARNGGDAARFLNLEIGTYVDIDFL